MSSSCQPATVEAVPGRLSRVWLGLIHFLKRRRVAISAAIFIFLVILDMAMGRKPYNVVDVRDWHSGLGCLLIAAGLALRSWAAGILKKGTTLTTSGPYSLIRNPLYIGSFLMMLGFCTVIGDLANFLAILGPILVLYLIKVREEEQGLETRFGKEWNLYAAATPRFLPRRLLTNGMTDWRLAQWLRSREYRAVLSTILALGALELWYAL